MLEKLKNLFSGQGGASLPSLGLDSGSGEQLASKCKKTLSRSRFWDETRHGRKTNLYQIEENTKVEPKH